MNCALCGVRKASVFQPAKRRALCKECFLEDVRSRVRAEVERWRMIEPGDRVLLALSGGKDSYVLLESIALYHSPSKLVGLSIVEGIPGYNREEDVAALKEVAKGYGVEIMVVRVKDFAGLSVHEMVKEARARGSPTSACTFCGVARRRIMSSVAEELGVDKLATAHNLDDEVQTAIMNILRGDLAGLLKLHPLSKGAGVRRVKPMRKIYEWESATYAMIRNFPFQRAECMFISEHPTLRARLRGELYRLERESPGALLRALELLDELLVPGEERVERCSRCGSPTAPSRSICRLCELLEELGMRSPPYTTSPLLSLRGSDRGGERYAP
ncbi:MAG: TIGR00269 family protein [Acidilobaceae archaeon]|nr:TIGR00269 family protein [Acidilobaceae archaeon]MCX8165909.1 TIGR00269 family protein [Acidilobaceae archaeon]MDW7974551.1 TIGR00269 family protein [Sulfolobales archaeon]